MSIFPADLKAFYPATINDTGTNGGRISHLPVTSGSPENVFGNVFSDERTVGSTKKRKLFLKVHGGTLNETLFSPGIYLDGPTTAEDHITFFVGTQRNTQAELTGSERKYGSGKLNAIASSGLTTLVVNVESAGIVSIFQNGDTVHVTDKAYPGAPTGNEEFLVISGAPSVSGSQVTITTASALVNTYAAGSKVASVYKPTNITANVTNWSETSGSGLFDETVYPLILNNIGAIEQSWTLTFIDSSNFTVVGDTVGSVGTGSRSSDFSPNNPNFGVPYFLLETGGFSGTWAAGNTITFQTHPAAVPIWEERIVPAGSTITGSNYVDLVFYGESA